jgi:hypothetical protein
MSLVVSRRGSSAYIASNLTVSMAHHPNEYRCSVSLTWRDGCLPMRPPPSQFDDLSLFAVAPRCVTLTQSIASTRWRRSSMIRSLRTVVLDLRELGGDCGDKLGYVEFVHW